MPARREPEWDALLAAAARLQRIVPDAVLVGGTAAALHAGHRVSYDDGHEVTRIKGWLVLRRNATRDYLDLVALAQRLDTAAAAVLVGLDDWYADQIGPGGERVATQLARQLAEPLPYDLSEVDLRSFRKLDGRWRDWRAVAGACGGLAVSMLDRLAEERP